MTNPMLKSSKNIDRKINNNPYMKFFFSFFVSKSKTIRLVVAFFTLLLSLD